MKIQVIKKATPRPAADAVCPWLVDVPGAPKKN
jgi:hypothetical protein